LIGCLRLNAIAFSETLGSARKYCPESRILYASSCRIFGEGIGALLNESAAINPVCSYGISKVAGMGSAKLFRNNHGLFVSSAILFNHESELRSSNFLSKKLALAAVRAKTNQSYTVRVSSLDAVADWGSARDYCQGMTAMLEVNKATDFVIASGELRTVRDFAEECFNVFGLNWRKHVKVETCSSPGRAWKLRGDSTLLQTRSSWRPKKSFAAMVQDLVLRTESLETYGQRSSNFHSYL
jgi:GDPmannose 4,6-dehydratase